MNTTDTYTKDGLINPMSFKGKSEAAIYYAYCESLPAIELLEKDYEFFVPEVISMVNKHRMDLRQKAMAVYGD